MKFFDWLSQEDKQRAVDLFIAHRNYISTGKGLTSFITEPLKLVLVGGVFVYPEWVKENILLSGLLVVLVYIVLPDLIGHWWDVKRYYHREAEWNNLRNPGMIELREAANNGFNKKEKE